MEAYAAASLRKGVDARSDERRDSECEGGPSASATRPRLRTAAIAVFALLTCLALAGPALAAPNTTVSFTFDDGRPSQMAAEQQLVGRGLVATFYIISAQIGQPGVMTLSRPQLAQGRRHGDRRAHGAPPRTCRRSRATRRSARSASAATGSWTGASTSTTWRIRTTRRTRAWSRRWSRCGYDSARSGGQLQCDSGHACAETMPPLDAYSLRTPNDFNSRPLSPR